MATLLIIGSGPGVGLSSAKALAITGHFQHVALVSRNGSRLADEAAAVEKAVADTGSATVQLHTFPTDITEFHALKKTIDRVKDLGELRCVIFNAARIQPSDPLEADVQELEDDLRIGALALYVTSQNTIPELKQLSSSSTRTAFIVTNSHLPEAPIAELLSLSVTKAAQQNMVQGLDAAYGDAIEFVVVKIKGTVGTETGHISSKDIAAKIVDVYEKALKGQRGELFIPIDPPA